MTLMAVLLPGLPAGPNLPDAGSTDTGSALYRSCQHRRVGRYGGRWTALTECAEMPTQYF